MATVWLVQHKGYDLTDARRFGEVKPLVTDPKANVFDMTARLADIHGGLCDAKKEDFLLISGYALLNIIAAGILMEKFGQVKLLVFNGISRTYEYRTLTRGQLQLFEPKGERDV